jgi:hypothetical protein
VMCVSLFELLVALNVTSIVLVTSICCVAFPMVAGSFQNRTCWEPLATSIHVN